MPTGKIKTLVHLSQEKYELNTQLPLGPNDKGYGIIEDELGRAIYFLSKAVDDQYDFKNLQCGQRLEYTLENGPYLRAESIQVLTVVSETTNGAEAEHAAAATI